MERVGFRFQREVYLCFVQYYMSAACLLDTSVILVLLQAGYSTRREEVELDTSPTCRDISLEDLFVLYFYWCSNW